MPSRPGPAGIRPLAAVAMACACLLAAAVVASIFLTTTHDAWAAVSAPGPAGPSDGILLVVAPVGSLLALWLGLGLTLSALSALPGAVGQAAEGLAARIAPAAVRKVVAFVLGTALTAAFVPGTAIAGSSAHQGSRSQGVSSAQAMGELGVRALGVGALADAAPDASFRFLHPPVRLIDGTDAAPSPSWGGEEQAAPHEPAAPQERVPPRRQPSLQTLDRVRATDASLAQDVVVHRGDTLWSIAARHLGPTATEADIDAEWHRWFAANRRVIGDDADQIAPGQLLSPPTPVRGRS